MKNQTEAFMKKQSAEEAAVSMVRPALFRCLGKYYNSYLEKVSAFALYVAMKLSPVERPDWESVLKNIADRGLRAEIRAEVTPVWDEFETLWDPHSCVRGVNEESLKLYLLEHPYSATTLLAVSLLQIQDRDKVVNYEARGDFFIEAYKANSKAQYFGMACDSDHAVIAAIRGAILGPNIEVEETLMYDEREKFDKIFFNFTRDMPRMTMDQRRICDWMSPEFGDMPKTRNDDWVIIGFIMDRLKADGKAVCIVNMGNNINSAEREARKYFASRGLIETVISLPSGREFSSCASALMVFSKGNSAVRMVDAGGIIGRDASTATSASSASDKDVKKILKAVRTDSEFSKLIPNSELIERDCDLDPEKRFRKPIEVGNGVLLETLIIHMRRGTQLSAKALDDLATAEPTEFQYLLTKDIQDGLIGEDLMYLREIDPNMEKCCLSSGDVVFTKNAPFKVSVIGDLRGKKVVANGNLYIIELDKAKIRPKYLQAFFESNLGAAVLKGQTVGSVITTISVEGLKQLMVPCPPLAAQDEFLSRYLAFEEKIIGLRRELQSTMKEAKDFLDQAEKNLF
jgi:type I restriction enzyme M protein